MKLSESFQEKVIEPMEKTVAAYAVAMAATLALPGCATLDRVSGVEAGGIPVGRVFTQSATQGTADARRAIRNEIAAPLRLTACPTQQQPRVRESGIGGALGNMADRLFSVNVTPTIGDPTCAQRLDGNGVGPRPTR